VLVRLPAGTVSASGAGSPVARAVCRAGGWVLEIDIRKFFDTLDHGHLRTLLRRRIRDGVLLRLIGKWLNAGALEEGALSRPDAGTPQGGVISPLLANVYLHEVLDEWFERDVKPRLKGRGFLSVMRTTPSCSSLREEDARRVMECCRNDSVSTA